MPARLSAIRRALERFGGTVEEPSSGSHWKAFRDGRCYPLAAHNGARTEISDLYIRGMCRALQLDEQEFRAML